MAKVLGDFGDQLDLQMRQGSTFGPHECVITNPDESAMDLSGCTIRASLRRNPGATEVVLFTVSVTDTAAGAFTFGLAKEATIGLVPPKYIWDMELQDAAGRVLPICRGEVLVELEVTR